MDPEAQRLWCADVQCDVARGAEELVCVLVLRGSCEKKERRRRDGIVEIIFLVLRHHLTIVSLVPCVKDYSGGV